MSMSARKCLAWLLRKFLRTDDNAVRKLFDDIEKNKGDQSYQTGDPNPPEDKDEYSSFS